MKEMEKRISQMDKRLEEIGRRITALQDLILNMKTTFETVTGKEVEKKYLTRLMLKTNENMNKFMEGRSPDCTVTDWCTRRVEKATSIILRAFVEQGSESAIEQAKYYTAGAIREAKEIKCADNKCLENAISAFRTIEKLIETSREESAKSTRDLYSPKSWSGLEEVGEEEIRSLLAPLSNVARLKILKNLAKGGKNYARLERQIGIKGGHLKFHLNSLAQASYVTQEKAQGNYLITMKGLRALRFSYELREAVLSVT